MNGLPIINEKLLDEFRGFGKCEICGAWCGSRDAHHVHERGANSWKRLDIRWNLISLGTMVPWLAGVCRCHSRFHNGALTRAEVIMAVATRENLSPQWIKDEHARILRECGKGGTGPRPD